jgi:hypothetical protein
MVFPTPWTTCPSPQHFMASPICKKEKGRKKKNLREEEEEEEEGWKYRNYRATEERNNEATCLPSNITKQISTTTIRRDATLFCYHKTISTIQLRHHGVVLSGRKDFHCSLEPIADNLARVWRQMSDKRKRERRSRWIYLKRQRKMRKEKKKLTAL